MDVLHYKILNRGTYSYALIASVNYPEIYLPCKVFIEEAVPINKTRYMYLVEVEKFYDDCSVLAKYFNNCHYRMYHYDKEKTWDHLIELDDTFFKTSNEYVQNFAMHYADQHLQVLAPLMFETKDQMFEQLHKYELSIAKNFAETIKLFRSRQIKNKYL